MNFIDWIRADLGLHLFFVIIGATIIYCLLDLLKCYLFKLAADSRCDAQVSINLAIHENLKDGALFLPQRTLKGLERIIISTRTPYAAILFTPFLYAGILFSMVTMLSNHKKEERIKRSQAALIIYIYYLMKSFLIAQPIISLIWTLLWLPAIVILAPACTAIIHMVKIVKSTINQLGKPTRAACNP